MIVELQPTTYLGPARVAEVAGARLRLAFPDQEVWASTALGYPYEPAPGDSVLVIGQEDAWYVIGVLHGSGQTTFMAPGDMRFIAPHGRIEFVANEVTVQSTKINLISEKLDVLARTVFERFTSAIRTVKDALIVRAGSTHTRAKSAYTVRAGTIVERAKGDVSIDGEQIRLG